MLSLYNILVEHRTRIVSGVLSRVPKDVKAYSRIPRGEMRESIEHLYDAYLDFVASGSDDKLRQIFGYVARVRIAQDIKLSAILRALLTFNVVIRPILQEIFRFSKENPNGRSDFNDCMLKLEQTTFSAIATFSDVFLEYMQSRVDEHNQYLAQKNKQLGIDLSKFVLFRG
jgi:hypothetical protein